MGEALRQSFQNLRANKLRSFLTMFGIVWGMISIVILSATGEGFRLGNEKVLLELGRNVGIVWGNRTSLQAGGERAGRRIFLTEGDARAIAAESSLVAVVSPEIERPAVSVKSLYNAANVRLTGVEPQFQGIRTIEVEYGRTLSWSDESQVARVAVVGYDDVPGAEYFDPPLTTIRQPFREMGAVATRLLIQTVEEPNSVHSEVLLKPELVRRHSCP